MQSTPYLGASEDDTELGLVGQSFAQLDTLHARPVDTVAPATSVFRNDVLAAQVETELKKRVSARDKEASEADRAALVRDLLAGNPEAVTPRGCTSSGDE